MTTSTVPDDVRAYLSAVRIRLDDLPTEEREDLLADVEPSILESAEESDVPVELVLGRSVLSGAESAEYMLAVTLGAVAVVAASVTIGSRRPRRTVPVALANVVLAIAAVPAAIHAVDAARTPSSAGVRVFIPPSARAAQEGMAYKGVAVENIYAFDRDGRLLQDVRLYDQFGRALEIGGGNPLRRPVRTRAGHAIFNAFPIRYFEAGTRLVANPAAGAPGGVGRLATRPLRHR